MHLLILFGWLFDSLQISHIPAKAKGAYLFTHTGVVVSTARRSNGLRTSHPTHDGAALSRPPHPTAPHLTCAAAPPRRTLTLHHTPPSEIAAFPRASSVAHPTDAFPALSTPPALSPSRQMQIDHATIPDHDPLCPISAVSLLCAMLSCISLVGIVILCGHIFRGYAVCSRMLGRVRCFPSK
jgi:hypothetical protein